MADVLILGSGPAGLSLGCYLAQAGIPCLIVERGHHPRPHVGESLMPASVRVLREIGFLPIMEAGHFPRSGGVVYHPASAPPVSVTYGEFPQEGVGQAHTYHVDRAKFDTLLMKHAESLGCRILEGATVREVLFSDDGFATGARVSIGGDFDVDLPARIVVDAAGRGTLLGRQLGLRRGHETLDQFGVHAWFLGVERGREATAAFTHVFMLPEISGWAWQAPIDEAITSIGVVAAREAFPGGDVDRFFERSLEGHPDLAAACGTARRINEVKGDANYSYRLERVCGDGWLAIGDAAQFIDPIFSSGVSVALHGARFASERIQTALEADDVSRSVFLPYERELHAGSRVMDEFVRLFYDRPAALTALVESDIHRPEVLRLIQGEIGPSADATLAAMREVVHRR